MELILLLILALIFGWAFTESYKRTCEKLTSQLSQSETAREEELKSFTKEKTRLVATIKELM